MAAARGSRYHRAARPSTGCGSGLDAVAMAARAIRQVAELIVAGGVESMTRAPFVVPRADSAFSRSNTVYDTTIGWRFVNKALKAGPVSIDARNRENVAEEFQVSRDDRMVRPRAPGPRARAGKRRLAAEIVPVSIPSARAIRSRRRRRASPPDQRRSAGEAEAIAREGGIRRQRVRVNDGAAALIIASAAAAEIWPSTVDIGAASPGVPPHIMGIGLAPATLRLLERLGLKIGDMESSN